MATMKFFNVLDVPSEGADDGTYYVKNGDYIDTYLVSSGKVEKLSAGVVGLLKNENLFNSADVDVEYGVLIGNNDTRVSFATGVISGYIPVELGGTYTLISGRVTILIALYDENKAWIKNVAGYGVGEIAKPFSYTVTDSSVAYFRVNINTTQYPIHEYKITKDLPASNYELKLLKLADNNFSNNIIRGEFIDDNSIGARHINRNTSNLLDLSTITDGYYIGGTQPILKANSTFAVTDFIPCFANTDYTISVGDPSQAVSVYNQDKEFINYISATSGYASKPFPFTIPQEGAYFRVSIRKTNVPPSEYIIALSTEFNYVEKRTLVPWLKVKAENIEGSLGGIIKSGKKLVTFGNSRTWYDGKTYGAGTKEAGIIVRGYQTHIREILGMSIINVGVSGTRIHQTVELLKTYTFTGDEYAISLMHGTNNFNAVAGGEAGYSLGSVDLTKSGDYDVMSYAGGLQEFVEWVSVNKPSLKMYLITDAWCYKSGYGGMERTYADVMRQVAELYHYPFLDLYHSCGFNEHNMDEYFVDAVGASYFHENTKGYERISEIIVPFILNN